MCGRRPRRSGDGAVYKVLLDTNQLISSLLSAHGLQRALIDHWRAGAFLLFVAPGQRQEATEVLARPKIADKYRITAADREAFLHLLEQDAILLPHHAAAGICRDADDDYFLGCAASAGIDYLVTGDNDLLTLKRFESVVILTARDFLIIISP
jgi:uncharacterized protein